MNQNTESEYRIRIQNQNTESEDNIAIRYLDLTLDHLNPVTLNNKKITYINLVIVVELLFKWNRKEEASLIARHLSEFIGETPHYRKKIRTNCQVDS